MARTDRSVFFLKNFLEAKLQELDEKQADTEGHSVYNSDGNDAVFVKVIHISRHCISPFVYNHSPHSWQYLYKAYVRDSDGVWVPMLRLTFLGVIDCTGYCGKFLLSPKHNNYVDKNEMKCGDFILLTNIAGRSYSEVGQYYEICDFEKPIENGSSRFTTFEEETNGEVAEKFASISSPFKNSVPMHLWNENVAMWPRQHRPFLEIPNEIISVRQLERICSAVDLEMLDRTWKNIPGSPGYLAVRIRTVGNSEFYTPRESNKELQAYINLKVYDSTGGCSVVLWDQSISAQQVTQLREGRVILLKVFQVRRDLSTNKYKVDFSTLRRFPIELHVNAERARNRKPVEIVDDVISEQLDNLLPKIEQPCNTFADLSNLWNTRWNRPWQLVDVFPVAGMVVGLSRFDRLRKEERQQPNVRPIGRFYVVRWVELYEPQSEKVLSVQVFINKQIEKHDALEIGDVVAFSFVRMCKRLASSIKEDLTYVTTTQHTELYVIKKSVDNRDDPLLVGIPPLVLEEMWRVRNEIGDPGAVEHNCWIGGTHQFSNTYFDNLKVRDISKRPGLTKVPKFLKNLVFWESVITWLPCKIAQIEFCQPKMTPYEHMSDKTGKIVIESSIIASSATWQRLKDKIPSYGCDTPYCLTLPMKYDSRRSDTLHEFFRFPRTDIYAGEDRAERMDEEIDEPSDFQILNKGFYKVTLVDDEEKYALSTIFIPMASKDPPSMTHALNLSHEPLRAPLESPVMTNMSIGAVDHHECEITANLILDKPIDAFVKFQCMGRGEYEILFCQLHLKKEEDFKLV